MHDAATLGLCKAEPTQMRLDGSLATPQEGRYILRRKALNHVFLMEKTLVEILGKFRNFNSINQIRGGRRKVAFSQQGPTILKTAESARVRRFFNFRMQ